MSKEKRDAVMIEFIEESVETIDRFAANIVHLEKEPTNKNILSMIYRDMHTLKGNAHLFGFTQISELTHSIENSLEPIRSGEKIVDATLVDVLYSVVDVIKNLIEGIRKNGCEVDMKDRIDKIISHVSMINNIKSSAGTMKQNVEGNLETKMHSNYIENKNDEDAKSKGFEVFEDINLEDKNLTGYMKKQNDEDTKSIGFEIFEDINLEDKKLTNRSLNNLSPELPENLSQTIPDDINVETIRVHVSLLDNLMNLIGEQVLVRNQILQHAKQNDSDSDLTKLSQRLNILTADLQKEVMKTRMQPIASILNKFHRLVRELGREMNKNIELELIGIETELDKTIIEAIRDPLTHIIRNAVDHGIESISERQAVGKPTTARLTVKAFHESGQVIVEISDDGKGLNAHLIGLKAVERGVITGDALNTMSEREILQLIYLPGFSTASNISAISGRGVGMDIVKTNVERIGGLVDLQSVVGKGTTVSLKIPLTLAIVPALIVGAIGQRFAIPRSKLVELVMIEDVANSAVRIEYLQGSPVLMLRGKILPLVNLSQIFQDPADKDVQVFDPTKFPINVVVVNADSFEYGLIVDVVEDTADVVVKALASFLKKLPQFSGATIMGDGSVALMIDILGALSVSKISAEAETNIQIKRFDDSSKKGTKNIDMVEYLLVKVGGSDRYAIPLTLISRLEEFALDRFELSGEQTVVRYRDSLLPIFSLSKFLNFPAKNDRDHSTTVIVIRRGSELFGIEVDGIQDIISLHSKIDRSIRDRPGVLGTVIADNKILTVVDILGMIDSLKTKINHYFDASITENDQSVSGSFKKKQRHLRILLAEDSSFFRSYVMEFLEEAGHQVVSAADGQEAWNLLNNASHDYFSLVVSDIEMPNKDGYELAKTISNDSRFKSLPLIAMTTLFSSRDQEKGLQSGFWRYLEKLKPEELLETIEKVMLEASNRKSFTNEVKRASNQ